MTDRPQPDRLESGRPDEPTDEQVVEAAASAAEEAIFSRFRRSVVRDVDVSVEFSAGVLDVEVYVNVPDADEETVERTADEAALAARAAVDDLLE